MSTERVRWFSIGVPLVVFIGIGLTIALRLSLQLPWSKLALPVGCFVGLQVGTFVCMFWARRPARTLGDYRAAIALFGLYCGGSGWLVLHYGTKWGLLSHHSDDDVVFSIVMVVAIVITFGIFSFSKARRGTLQK